MDFPETILNEHLKSRRLTTITIMDQVRVMQESDLSCIIPEPVLVY